MAALTTKLHITPGKYEASYLKFGIIIVEIYNCHVGCLGVSGVSGGVKGVTSDMTVQS